MGDGDGSSSSRNLPRSVEEVFVDYDNRRRGIQNALLHQAEYFFQQCSPLILRPLCLYAYPNGSWEVLHSENLEEIDDTFPRPMLGINIPRDNMSQEDWLTLVAIHSDSWLVGVAAYFAALNGFHENDTKRLFQLINGVPTVAESFTAANRTKLTPAEDGHVSIPNFEASPPAGMEISKPELKQQEETGDEYDEELDGDGTEPRCVVCKEEYKAGEVWICCDVCDRWCHAECVRITVEMIQGDLKQFKCPPCASKKRQTT